MKLHLLPFLIFLLLLVGCTTSNEQIKMVWKERNIPEMTPLQESDSLVIPQTFNLLTWSINGSSIYFVSSGIQDNFLSVYRYPECVKRFDFGRIGQGPDEFITLNAGEARNNRLLLYDIMGRKALLLDTEDDTLCIADRLELYNDEEGLCRPFTYITQMDTDNYVMKIDDATSSAWEIADLKSGEVKSSFENLNRTEKYSYTPFDFIQCIGDTTLLVAYKYMDKIEYYSIKDCQIHPLFAMGSHTNQAEIKDYNYLMQYYVDVVFRNGLFYCLKSDDGMESGNLIEVYDMQGQCKANYLLDKKISSMRFDMNGFLIGYVDELNQTTLYRFAPGKNNK